MKLMLGTTVVLWAAAAAVLLLAERIVPLVMERNAWDGPLQWGEAIILLGWLIALLAIAGAVTLVIGIVLALGRR